MCVYLKGELERANISFPYPSVLCWMDCDELSDTSFSVSVSSLELAFFSSVAEISPVAES